MQLLFCILSKNTNYITPETGKKKKKTYSEWENVYSQHTSLGLWQTHTALQKFEEKNLLIYM